MNPTDPNDIDPVGFVTDALALLPDDPAETDLDDLRTLAALTEGFTRHTSQLRSDMAALARRTLDCGEDELSALVAERTRLELRELRTDLADRNLTKYADDALRAHGFNLDRLIAGP